MLTLIEWRGHFASAEVDVLPGAEAGFDWRALAEWRGLGWCCARDGGRLVGFVRVTADGAGSAYAHDLVVALDARGRGIGGALLAEASSRARAHACGRIMVVPGDAAVAAYAASRGLAPPGRRLIGAE